LDLARQQLQSSESSVPMPVEETRPTPPPHPLLSKLKTLDINCITPKDALDLLYHFKQELSNEPVIS